MSKEIYQGELTYGGDRPIRLDLFLVEKLPNLSRSKIQQAIERGNVLVNSQVEKSKFKLRRSDLVSYKIDDADIDLPDIPAQEIPLDILYEDNDVIVINKQPGLASHPTSNQTENTLVNALLGYYEDISKVIYDPDSPKSRIRPGIVHRLDKDTTGVIIVAKSMRALKSLSTQMKNRKVVKKYLALCHGWPDEAEGELNNHLGRDPHNRKTFTEVGESCGKKAQLTYKIQKHLSSSADQHFSLIEFTLLTGRTHQIRAQAKLWGHPIIGDHLYYTEHSKAVSRELAAHRQLLHSFRLEITLPDKRSLSTFTAELPADFRKVLGRLEDKS